MDIFVYNPLTMNEILFFIQIIIIVGFALGALKLGKGALTAWVAIQALVANLFVLKQITLFGFDVTASDAYAIGSILGLNFLQEFFDKEDAQKATWICFFFMTFFAVVSQLHLLYIPSTFDSSHQSFSTILSVSPRLLVASMSVFFIVQQFDIRFFAFLKNKWPSANFAVRAGIALVASQLIDTILFSFTGLYGIVASVVDIIVISFAVKMIVIFCFSSLMRWAKT
jgi:queuosine precursor transporter